MAGQVRKDIGSDERLVSMLNSRRGKVIHVTHNDLDAVGGDAIHRMAYVDVVSIFCSVGNFPGVLETIAKVNGKGDVLSISDLGYPNKAEPLLARITANGWHIHWRDHHRWKDDEVASAARYCDLLNLDVTTCATGICARDLQPGVARAREVAMVVCDYDLWKHEDPRSAVLGLVLQRKKNRDYVRDRLVDGIFSDDLIQREYEEIAYEMQEMMSKSIRRATVLGSRYRIAFAPLYGYPSETAAEMRKELSTDIEVLISPGGRFSLRSVPPISHIIAREFGGGGHPNAAGGSFDFSFWDRVRFILFRKTSHFSRFVDLAESL